MTKLAQKLKAAGAKVALLTPSPEEKFEPDAPAGSAYNRMLEKYSEGVKEVATKEQTAFVDQLHPFIKILEEAREKGLISKDGKDSLPRLMPDAIHPTMSGHLIMAWAILKGLEAPALVSEATLTASNVTDSKNCKIEMLSGSAGQIRFKRTDDAMPMPIWPESKLALTFPGLTVADDLNRYMLKVAGLSANEYELLIDNKSVGKFSKDTLEAGLNLSTLTIGPIYEQGKKLFETIAIKNTMYFIRWRQVQLYEPKELPEWLRKIDLTPARTAEMERLDNEITKYEAQIETYRKPVPHEFLLKPAA
jgi:hypothetical protein